MIMGDINESSNINNLSTNGSQDMVGEGHGLMKPPTIVVILNPIGFGLGIMSIVLNLFFLITCCLVKGKHNAHRQFMTNLSVADIMCAPAFLLVQYWPHGLFSSIQHGSDFILVQALPYVFRSLPWLFFTAYLLTLNCLAINQWLAISKPWRYSLLATPCKIRITLAVVWSVASLQLMVPVVALFLLSSLQNKNEAQEILFTVSRIEMQTWMGFYALSIIFNIYISSKVYLRINFLKNKRRGQQMPISERTNIKLKQKSFVTITMLLGTCIVCRLPFPLFGIIGVSFSHQISLTMYIIGNAGCVLLLYLNCFIDPIIYLCRTKDVRDCLKAISSRLCKVEHVRQRQSIQSFVMSKSHGLTPSDSSDQINQYRILVQMTNDSPVKVSSV